MYHFLNGKNKMVLILLLLLLFLSLLFLSLLLLLLSLLLLLFETDMNQAYTNSQEAREIDNREGF